MAKSTQRKEDEVRAAIMAALLEGQGVSKVARDLKVSKATVSRIKNTVAPEHLKQLETEKRENIAELMISHLTTSLKAANALAEKAAINQSWFDKQSAGEIAVLYGVLSDKAIRLVEAIEISQEPTGDANT
jgi:transposase-like protein